MGGDDANRQAKAAAALIVSYLATGYVILDDCEETPTRETFIEAIFDHLGVPEGETMSAENFEQLLTDLAIMPEGEEDHDDHRHKRSALRRRKREVADNGHHEGHEEGHLLKECLGERVLDVFHVDEDTGLTSSQFGHLCPALIQQQLDKSCSENHEEEDGEKIPSNAEKYGYGTLAVVIISLVSLIGVVIVPLSTTERYRDILSFFVALAVGSLIGDATLHLIPLAMGIHAHDHSADGPIVVENFVYRALVIIAAIAPTKFQNVGYMTPTVDEIHDIKLSNTDDPEKHIPDSHVKVFGVAIVGWMILLSDAIHNFADGLVIGAAFNHSLSSGLSTSIAVFCHELPHEIGDFAVLLNSGMGRLKAAGLNLLSALTAVIGFYVGIVLANNEEARDCIFTATAGMFIYVSLVNMVPELMVMLNCVHRVRRFIFQNLGLLLGVTILTLIAVFESKIKL